MSWPRPDTAGSIATSIRWRRPAFSLRPTYRSVCWLIRRRADLGRLPLGSHDASIRRWQKLHAEGADQSVLQLRHAVQAHGASARRQDFGGDAVRRITLPSSSGFRKIIDNTFMIATMIHWPSHPHDLRKYFAALKRAQRDLDLRAGTLYALLQERVSGALARGDGHPPLGNRASCSYSRPIPKRPSTPRATGSRSVTFSKAATSAPSATRTLRSA